MNFRLIFIFLLVLQSCGKTSEKQQFGYRYDTGTSDKFGKPIDSRSFYFDPVSFRDTFPIPYTVIDPPYDTVENVDNIPKEKIKLEFRIRTDSIYLESFSKTLFDNEEPILSNYYLGRDIFRLTWIRSFHQGVIVTISKNDEACSIETKWLMRSDIKFRTSEKQFSEIQYSELLSMLKTSNFYSAESKDWNMPDADGSQWILEAHTAEGYHFITQQSPDFGQSNGLREIGEFLIKNSEAKGEEIY